MRIWIGARVRDEVRRGQGEGCPENLLVESRSTSSGCARLDRLEDKAGKIG
jgi:hypothetical protein